MNEHIQLENHYAKRYSCNKCDFRATRQDNVKKHIEFVHEGSRQFSCNHCDKAYMDNAELKKHVQGFHEKDKGWNKCNICQKNFYGKCGLKRHIKPDREGEKLQMWNLRLQIRLKNKTKGPYQICSSRNKEMLMSKRDLNGRIISKNEDEAKYLKLES